MKNFQNYLFKIKDWNFRNLFSTNHYDSTISSEGEASYEI
jgi:hypothetical protein